MTAAPPSPPHEAHLSGHVHGEEAVEIVARAVLSARWPQGDLIAALTNRTAPMVAEAVLEALVAAGLLATEQEWGVRYESVETIGRSYTESYKSQSVANVVQGREGGTVVSRGVTPWREQAPTPDPVLLPFTAEELSMDMGTDGTYPFVEGESAEITGYGHQDKAAFAAEINRYDKAMNGPTWDEEGWTASDISHQWAVRNTEETCTVYADRQQNQHVTPETPGAFPITTLWNAR